MRRKAEDGRRRHAELLDSVHAAGVMHLFADVDLASLPPDLELTPFASPGLTDPDFNPKPVLAAWDALFARRLVPQP